MIEKLNRFSQKIIDNFGMLILIYLLVFINCIDLFAKYTDYLGRISLIGLTFLGTLTFFVYFLNNKSTIDKNLKLYFVINIIFFIYVLFNGIYYGNKTRLFYGGYQYVVYYFVFFTSFIFIKKRNIKKYIKIMLAVNVVSALMLVYEFLSRKNIIYDKFGRMAYDGIVIIRGKALFGSFLNAGIVMCVCCFLAIYFIYEGMSEKNREKVYKYIFLLFIYIAGVFSTGSRGPLVVLIIGAFIGFSIYTIFLANNKKLFITVIVVTVLLGILSIFIILNLKPEQINNPMLSFIVHRVKTIFDWNKDTGNVLRIKRWQFGISLFNKNPLIGIGIAATGAKGLGKFSLGVTESGMIKKLAEMGIVGVLLTYSIYILIIKEGIRTIKEKFDYNVKMLTLCLLSILFAIFIEDLIYQATETEVVSFYIFVIASFIFKLRHDDRDESENAEFFEKIFLKAKNLFGEVIRFISKIMPRNKKVLVFGAWFGEKFLDNPKYLYLQAIKKRQFIPVWISGNKKLLKKMRRKGYRCYYKWEIKGIYYQLIAGTYFTCTSNREDVAYQLLGGANNINLWHGIPLKKICYDDNLSEIYNKQKLRNKIEQLYKDKTYVVSSSEVISMIYESAFRIEKDKILEFGQPRNDVFFDDSLDDDDFPLFIQNNKTILYMPTHRREGKKSLDIEKNFDLNELNKFCVKNDIIFLIKKHFYHRDEKENLNNYSNIKDITNMPVDSQMLLKYSDILITDYSSCYIDYLLLDRPIIFYNFDYDEYLREDRNLYFDYDKVTPGEKAINFNELLNCLKELIENNKDDFKEIRNKVKSLFYSQDNQKKVSKKFFDILE